MRTNVKELQLEDIIQLLALTGCSICLSDFRPAMVHRLFKHYGYENRTHTFAIGCATPKSDVNGGFQVILVNVWLGESGELEAMVSIRQPLLKGVHLARVQIFFENIIPS